MSCMPGSRLRSFVPAWFSWRLVYVPGWFVQSPPGSHDCGSKLVRSTKFRTGPSLGRINLTCCTLQTGLCAVMADCYIRKREARQESKWVFSGNVDFESSRLLSCSRSTPPRTFAARRTTFQVALSGSQLGISVFRIRLSIWESSVYLLVCRRT